jgi:hypothetical protein
MDVCNNTASRTNHPAGHFLANRFMSRSPIPEPESDEYKP